MNIFPDPLRLKISSASNQAKSLNGDLKKLPELSDCEVKVDGTEDSSINEECSPPRRPVANRAVTAIPVVTNFAHERMKIGKITKIATILLASWTLPALLFGIPRLFRIGFPFEFSNSAIWWPFFFSLNMFGAFGFTGGVAFLLILFMLSRKTRTSPVQIFLLAMVSSFLLPYFVGMCIDQNPFATRNPTFISYFYLDYLVSMYGINGLLGGVSAVCVLLVRAQYQSKSF